MLQQSGGLGNIMRKIWGRNTERAILYFFFSHLLPTPRENGLCILEHLILTLTFLISCLSLLQWDFYLKYMIINYVSQLSRQFYYTKCVFGFLFPQDKIIVIKREA